MFYILKRQNPKKVIELSFIFVFYFLSTRYEKKKEKKKKVQHLFSELAFLKCKTFKVPYKTHIWKNKMAAGHIIWG